MSYAYTNFQFLRTSSYVIVLPERTGHIDYVQQYGTVVLLQLLVEYRTATAQLVSSLQYIQYLVLYMYSMYIQQNRLLPLFPECNSSTCVITVVLYIQYVQSIEPFRYLLYVECISTSIQYQMLYLIYTYVVPVLVYMCSTGIQSPHNYYVRSRQIRY